MWRISINGTKNNFINNASNPISIDTISKVGIINRPITHNIVTPIIGNINGNKLAPIINKLTKTSNMYFIFYLWLT